ncbi:hypothetical protein HCN51_04345 [Nonomuraea sp. FMUSA5-5]|uniref:Uncharacterized protein n=1 Tax=Nonomuraea composti TaxID=2720023 RepID=A0ABX1AST3_9ACTN|nr:hypothetical protein [Nonomuraea sp. FMUSA5-5]NJP88695.1 hypothetical protein [Nonomuraea sp. FMUSA5-5]
MPWEAIGALASLAALPLALVPILARRRRGKAHRVAAVALKELERDEPDASFPTAQAPVGRLPIRVLGREGGLDELRDAVRTRDPHVHVLAGQARTADDSGRQAPRPGPLTSGDRAQSA